MGFCGVVFELLAARLTKHIFKDVETSIIDALFQKMLSILHRHASSQQRALRLRQPSALLAIVLSANIAAPVLSRLKPVSVQRALCLIELYGVP